jgi:hypothetical protein
MKIVYLLIASLLQLQSRGIFEIAILQGEGPHIFRARTNELPLRNTPSLTSPIGVKVKTSPGQQLTYDNELSRTTRVGHFKVLSGAQIEGRLFGPLSQLSRQDYYYGNFSRTNTAVAPGTTVEYLQYRAEGSCFIRIDGNAIEASPCPEIDMSKFKVEGEPQTEEWIHVKIGSSSGWVLVSGDGSKLVDGDS